MLDDSDEAPVKKASSLYEILESVESMGKVVANTVMGSVVESFISGNIEAGTRSTILTVNDRYSGREIYRCSGITLQTELDAIRVKIRADLTGLSVEEFRAKYSGKDKHAGYGVQLSDTRVCDECHRTIARSEIMRFNTALTKRAKWDVLCPACGDERTRHRAVGRAPKSYVIDVPDQDFHDECVRSYVVHGWTIEKQSSSQTVLTQGNRQVTVRTAI